MPRLKKIPTTAHRILVVDDDAALRKSLCDLLKAEGHEVFAAGTVEEGIGLTRSAQPHLILLDYFLGDDTGASLVRVIRTFDTTAQIILVTGYASEKPARQLLAELEIQGYHDKADGAERLLVQVDAALKYYRALAKLRRQGEYLKDILETIPAISKLQTPRALLNASLRGLIHLLGGKNGLVATSENGVAIVDTHEVTIHAGTGEFEGIDSLDALPTPLKSVVQRGLSAERPGRDASGYVILPLRTQGGTRGCMAVECDDFPEEAYDPTEIFGRKVVQALENILLYEKATIDPLTKLQTRDFGQQRLVETLRLAGRVGTPTSILLADVDHFKALNDTHGHAAGDMALSRIGQTIRDACRTTDVAARFGGEEMLVVLPATNAPGAAVVAERIRRNVEALDMSFEGAPVRCTISIGTATSGPDEHEAEALLRMADRALYRAKSDGRNAVRAGEAEAAAQ